LCGFTPPTVWAGVNASHCPIACLNRRIQPERYMQFWLELVEKCRINNMLTKKYTIDIIFLEE
jgi:hypothetical protein